MCRQNPESREYLLCVLLWPEFMELIFGIFEEAWVLLYSLESSRQVRFKSFGSHRDAEIPWRCSCFAILWCIWTELNARCVDDTHLFLRIPWDRVFLQPMGFGGPLEEFLFQLFIEIGW